MKTTMLDGARALAELLDDAPAWLPTMVGWEIAAPTDADPRHVMGQLPDKLPGVQRRELRALADEIGGTYETRRSTPEAKYESAYVHFWYAGVRFTLWACVPVRMGAAA